MEHATLIMTLAVTFGLFMAWGIGANDVANAMGTSVGSKAFTFKQAIIAAAIFESAGAILVGGEVTQTIRSEIINVQLFANEPQLLVYGMLASLLAAGIWLVVASRFGWPVSTTHSIVGAVIGFAVVGIGPDVVDWTEVAKIFSSWIFTPIIAGVLAFGLFTSVQKLILQTKDPFHQAKRYVPFYIFLVSMIISMVTLVKGIKHLGLNFSFLSNLLIASTISIGVALFGTMILRRIKLTSGQHLSANFASTERIFGVLMMFTACAMAFAHGSNDVANAIAPLAAIVSVVKSGGIVSATSPTPLWILGLGAVGIVAGLSMYGYRVMATIGEKITELTPSRGFAAELATASTVVIASGIGLPVSTTQTLVGAILGVGLARGIAALNLRVIGNIFMSWIVTLPIGALLSSLIFYVIKWLL